MVSIELDGPAEQVYSAANTFVAKLLGEYRRSLTSGRLPTFPDEPDALPTPFGTAIETDLNDAFQRHLQSQVYAGMEPTYGSVSDAWDGVIELELVDRESLIEGVAINENTIQVQNAMFVGNASPTLEELVLGSGSAKLRVSDDMCKLGLFTNQDNTPTGGHTEIAAQSNSFKEYTRRLIHREGENVSVSFPLFASQWKPGLLASELYVPMKEYSDVEQKNISVIETPILYWSDEDTGQRLVEADTKQEAAQNLATALGYPKDAAREFSHDTRNRQGVRYSFLVYQGYIQEKYDRSNLAVLSLLPYRPASTQDGIKSAISDAEQAYEAVGKFGESFDIDMSQLLSSWLGNPLERESAEVGRVSVGQLQGVNGVSTGN